MPASGPPMLSVVVSSVVVNPKPTAPQRVRAAGVSRAQVGQAVPPSHGGSSKYMTQPFFDDGAQRAAGRPRMSFRPRQQLVPDVECSLHLDHSTPMRRHAQVAFAILPIFQHMALPD